MPRRYLKSIVCALSALIAWAILPGTFIDHGLFSLTARSFAEKPFFITGSGSHESAHTLRTLKRLAAPPGDPLPDIVITDDPERVFQASPPSPVDFAVILKNLRRLGRDSVAIGMPLAWQQTDVISLMSIDQQLDALPSVITAAPLSRGAVPSPLPPAFRRASIALSEVRGNTGSLPGVNRVALPDTVLGNKVSLAGFTLLESEPDGGLPHLLARWDDRVVFSFPLLAALADHGVSPGEIEIQMGSFISLGKDGPFIPIDDFGRLAFAPPSPENPASIPAENLIDAPENFLAERRPGTVLIRNAMSAADVPSMRFSETLVPTVSLLADPSGTSASRSFNRIPWLAELLLIASLICLLHGLEHFQKTKGRRALMVLAVVLAVLHFILVPSTGTWPPTLPAFCALLTAIPLTVRRKVVSTVPEITATKPTPGLDPEFQLEMESLEKGAPAPKAAAQPTAKKAAKTPAKRAQKKPSKKASAKKTPSKRKGR